jgi:hypothetical protein
MWCYLGCATNRAEPRRCRRGRPGCIRARVEARRALPWRGEGDDMDPQRRPEHRYLALASGSRSTADGRDSSRSRFPCVSAARPGARGDRVRTGATACVEDRKAICGPPLGSGWDGALQLSGQTRETSRHHDGYGQEQAAPRETSAARGLAGGLTIP